MADFCKQCSEEIFDEDFEQLKGLSTPEDTENELYASAICEGCGFIQVDHHGQCISPQCLKKHGVKNVTNNRG